MSKKTVMIQIIDKESKEETQYRIDLDLDTPHGFSNHGLYTYILGSLKRLEDDFEPKIG